MFYLRQYSLCARLLQSAGAPEIESSLRCANLRIRCVWRHLRMNTQILKRYLACALMCFSVASLSGCDQPSQSNTASQSRTSTPEVSKVEDGTSRTLTRVEGIPVHNLERIQNVDSPYGQQSISISSVSDTVMSGWAVDGLAKKEAGGVDIVMDGKIYKANYGSDRPDVPEL